MTEEQRKQVAENPKDFLKCCWYHEQRIKEKQELIRHYQEMAESITAEISIQDDIRKEISELRKDLHIVQEVIDLLDDSSQRLLMEARYLRHMKWEDIMELLDISYRWTLRLHGIALQKISEKAMLIHV